MASYFKVEINKFANNFNVPDAFNECVTGWLEKMKGAKARSEDGSQGEPLKDLNKMIEESILKIPRQDDLMHLLDQEVGLGFLLPPDFARVRLRHHVPFRLVDPERLEHQTGQRPAAFTAFVSPLSWVPSTPGRLASFFNYRIF